jgi:hypothetical protein
MGQTEDRIDSPGGVEIANLGMGSSPTSIALRRGLGISLGLDVNTDSLGNLAETPKLHGYHILPELIGSQGFLLCEDWSPSCRVLL